MHFVSETPPSPLGEHVASVWYFEGYGIEHAMERIVPNGAMQLLVNLEEDSLRWWSRENHIHRLKGTALSGAYAQAFAIDTAQQRAITGVSFVPGGAAAFFSGAMHEYSNTHTPLADLPGCDSIRDQLLEARNRGGASVLRTWMRFLEGRFAANASPAMVRARALLEKGQRISDVAEEVGFSVRKLRGDFKEWVGLGPKAYARIHRLRRVIRSIAKGPVDNWAALAVEHGFFDQAHMVREFRSLSGTTPAEYFPQSAEAWNHSILSG